MAKKIKPAPGQTVVYVREKQSHGCLIFALVVLCFGWLWGWAVLAVMAAWKLTKFAWRWTVEVAWHWAVRSVKWSWLAFAALCVWSWKGSRAATLLAVRQVRSLAARDHHLDR